VAIGFSIYAFRRLLHRLHQEPAARPRQAAIPA